MSYLFNMKIKKTKDLYNVNNHLYEVVVFEYSVSNTYFVEYLRKVASKLVRYQAHIFLSEVHLDEEEEYIKII